jgi:hypothetical protein
MLNHEHFHELARQHAGPCEDAFLYVLVDHAGIPGLSKKLTEAKVKWTNLLGDAKESTLPAAPLLFTIHVNERGQRQETLLDWIGKRGTYTSSMLLLASPLPMPALAQRLAERLDVMLPENMEVTLRFFDPRIFEQLMHVLSPEQKTAFLSVAHRWWFVDRGGKLQHVDAVFVETDPLASPFSLTREQEHALVDASEPDQLAQMLEEGMPEACQGMPLPERYDFVVRHMNAARRLGIRSTHDLSLYCALALLHGEDFATREKWQAALQDVQAGKLSLPLAAAQIADN